MSLEVVTGGNKRKKGRNRFTGGTAAIRGECVQLVGEGMKVKILEDHSDYRIIALIHWGITKLVLQVLGVKISSFHHDRNKRTPWFFEHSGLFDKVDIVFFSYGQSKREGARGKDTGNRDKNHFRRLAYIKDVKVRLDIDENGNVFDEIDSKFCEENIRRLFTEKPLLLRGRGEAG